MDIDVTIVIPVYNAESYIRKCIESILRQTYTNWEIIAIDDGSTDNSLVVLCEYEKKYHEKIRVISQSNSGVANARNKGIKEAKGKYIMFIDNDDYIDQDYIINFMKLADDGDFDCIVSGFRRENSMGEVIEKFVPTNIWSVYIADFAPWARIIKKDFLRENNIYFLNSPIGEDIFFNYKMLAKTDKVGIIKESGYVWYYNEKSVSNVKQKGLKEIDEFLLLLDKIKSISEGKPVFFEYWIIRYAIWYLLYSGSNASYKRFLWADKRIFTWMRENNIKMVYPINEYTKQDNIKVKFGIRVYIFLHKLHLNRLFALLYCKGEK